MMFQKRILSKPKWRAQAVARRGHGPLPPVVTALGPIDFSFAHCLTGMYCALHFFVFEVYCSNFR